MRIVNLVDWTSNEHSGQKKTVFSQIGSDQGLLFFRFVTPLFSNFLPMLPALLLPATGEGIVRGIFWLSGGNCTGVGAGCRRTIIGIVAILRRAPDRPIPRTIFGTPCKQGPVCMSIHSIRASIIFSAVGWRRLVRTHFEVQLGSCSSSVLIPLSGSRFDRSYDRWNATMMKNLIDATFDWLSSVVEVCTRKYPKAGRIWFYLDTSGRLCWSWRHARAWNSSLTSYLARKDREPDSLILYLKKSASWIK